MGRPSRYPPFPEGFPLPTQPAGAGPSPVTSLVHHQQQRGESRTSGRPPQPPSGSRLRDFQLCSPSVRLSVCPPACLLFIFPASDLSPSQRRHKEKYSRGLQIYKYSSERAPKSLEGEKGTRQRRETKAKDGSAAADAPAPLGFGGDGPNQFAVGLGGLFSGAGRRRQKVRRTHHFGLKYLNFREKHQPTDQPTWQLLP